MLERVSTISLFAFVFIFKNELFHINCFTVNVLNYIEWMQTLAKSSSVLSTKGEIIS